MYAPMTEETCTGTGDTLTLTGATTGHIPFGASFADGALCAYVVIDSGGTILVAGKGTYNTTGDTITRSDEWHYDGTVDEAPSSNIALSGGTHTVRCDVIHATMPYSTGLATQRLICAPGALYNQAWGGFAADTMYYTPFFNHTKATFSTLGMEVSAGLASTNCRVGIYEPGPDGMPRRLISGSGEIDVATGGEKTIAVTSFTLQPGFYWNAMLGNGAFDPFASGTNYTVPLGNTSSINICHMSVGSVAYGALPATAPVTSPSYNTSRAILVFAE